MWVWVEGVRLQAVINSALKVQSGQMLNCTFNMHRRARFCVSMCVLCTCVSVFVRLCVCL